MLRSDSYHANFPEDDDHGVFFQLSLMAACRDWEPGRCSDFPIFLLKIILEHLAHAVIDTPLTDNPCNTTDNWYLTKCFVRRKLPRLSLLEYLFKNSVLSVFSGEFLQNSRLG